MTDPRLLPADWHPRECVQDFGEIDYGFHNATGDPQVQLGPPIVLEKTRWWALLLIPVFRDVGPGAVQGGRVCSRLEFHVSRWTWRAKAWRRTANLVLRDHHLEALAGTWWSGELDRVLAARYDYKALKALKAEIGVQRAPDLETRWVPARDLHPVEQTEYPDDSSFGD